MPKKQKTPIPEIQRIAMELKLWREQKKHGDRIPEWLWEAAVQLCKSHGLRPVFVALQLDYNPLKKRLSASTPQVRSEKKKRLKSDPKAPQFVEVTLSPEKSECVLELENQRGEKLKVEMRGVSLEIEKVLQHFWSRDR